MLLTTGHSELVCQLNRTDRVALLEFNLGFMLDTAFAAPIDLSYLYCSKSILYTIDGKRKVEFVKIDRTNHALMSFGKVLNWISLTEELDPFEAHHDQVRQDDKASDGAAPFRVEILLALVKETHARTVNVQALYLAAEIHNYSILLFF